MRGYCLVLFFFFPQCRAEVGLAAMYDGQCFLVHKLELRWLEFKGGLLVRGWSGLFPCRQGRYEAYWCQQRSNQVSNTLSGYHISISKPRNAFTFWRICICQVWYTVTLVLIDLLLLTGIGCQSELNHQTLYEDCSTKQESYRLLQFLTCIKRVPTLDLGKLLEFGVDGAWIRICRISINQSEIF